MAICAGIVPYVQPCLTLQRKIIFLNKNGTSDTNGLATVIIEFSINDDAFKSHLASLWAKSRPKGGTLSDPSQAGSPL